MTSMNYWCNELQHVAKKKNRKILIAPEFADTKKSISYYLCIAVVSCFQHFNRLITSFVSCFSYKRDISLLFIIYLFIYLFQVSWVRHRDVHLLTVAGYTYSADQRFRAINKPYFGELSNPHGNGPDSIGSGGGSSSSSSLNGDLESLTDTYQDWGLEIHSSQPRDSGIYECQISTTPHRSLFLHLRVVGKSPMRCYFHMSLLWHHTTAATCHCRREDRRIVCAVFIQTHTLAHKSL